MAVYTIKKRYTLSKKNNINLRIGMPEIMLVSGVYIHSDAKYVALSLVILGILSAFVRYCMIRNDDEAREKTTKQMIKDMCDSATAVSLSSAIPKPHNTGGFH
tara:strand:- start:55 stop:363 length:309 start_codon:yes stop_codon:yes gene_type:complete